jgi:hypothetical protein
LLVEVAVAVGVTMAATAAAVAVAAIVGIPGGEGKAPATAEAIQSQAILRATILYYVNKLSLF